MNEKMVLDNGKGTTNASYFRSLVGGLNYLSHTRPDITFSVSLISRFMHSPSKQHLGADKRILRYVVGIIRYGIWYSKVSVFRLIGFTDSDLAGSLENLRSISGNFFSLGSGAISWSSRKQDTIALLSSEAEYMAATSTGCQAIWLRKLLVDLQQEQIGPIEIWCDNKAAIAMTKNPAFHSSTKHIDIRYHFIHNLVAGGIISLKFCGTNDQVANVLTKSLPHNKHDFFRLQMGVCDFEERGVLTNSSIMCKSCYGPVF
ncbi:hypothetical protein P3S67_029300 [Capsicum chacoense]